MFSVSASPFNSRARSLYGGWTASANASSLDENALRDFYGTAANAPTMYQDSKWANIIMRFSRDGNKRLLAKKIKAATKNMLKTWREDAAWKKGYRDALKAMRSPYKRMPLSDEQRAAIVSTFESIDDDTKVPGELAWMSALSRAPFVANPMLPGVSTIGNNLLWSAPDYLIGTEIDPIRARRDLNIGPAITLSRLNQADVTDRNVIINAYPESMRQGLMGLTDAELLARAIKDGVVTPTRR